MDTSTWLEFATADDSVSFRYPGDWALESDSEQIGSEEENVDPDARWMDWAELTAPNGQQLLAFYDFIDIGGACGGDSVQPLEVLATEATSARTLDGGDAVIATVALGTVDGRWRVGVGITQPEYLDRPTCAVYFVGGSADGGVGFGTHFQLTSSGEDPLWTVDSLDDARAYLETDEYSTVMEILRSFEST